MSDQANDFLKNYQAMAQQSWERFMQSVQTPVPEGSSHPFSQMPPGASTGQDTAERAMAGLKSYMAWMQGAAAAGNASQGENQGEWSQPWQQWLAGAGKPLAQGFGSADAAGAESFIQQLQSWINAGQKGSFNPSASPQTAASGFSFDQEHQPVMEAFKAAWQASARYQALIEKASKQGMERFQSKIGEHADRQSDINTLKALYDLWVEASEEAYAEMSNSGEFREAYGEMVNTQMAAREVLQKQVAKTCQHLGIPTRDEVSNLGERLQQLRRDCRAMAVKLEEQTAEAEQSKRELEALRLRLSAAEKQTDMPKPEVSVARKAPAAKKPAATKAVAKTPAKASKSSAAIMKKPTTEKSNVKKSAVGRKRAAATRASAVSSSTSTRARKR